MLMRVGEVCWVPGLARGGKRKEQHDTHGILGYGTGRVNLSCVCLVPVCSVTAFKNIRFAYL